jgi:riboflavin kinase/FMN adenylyltransferase
MRIFRSLSELPPDFGPSALTIGNFDGMHMGHCEIVRRIRAVADARGYKASVLTFDPHPTRIVAPERAPKLLTTLDRRLELMAAAGAQQALVLPFTADIAKLTPEEFVRQILSSRLGAHAILVGDNFRFGAKQAGHVDTLRALGAQCGFEVLIAPVVEFRGAPVSSSAIRALIAEGRVSRAARYLGRPYDLEGPIVTGRGVGGKQTAPTLNLATSAEVIPARGVYVTRTLDAASHASWDSVTNIGYRPTFGASDELTIETFVMGSLARKPENIRLSFLARLREERKFETPDALKAQILRDVHAAQSYFRRSKSGTRPCPTPNS